MKDLSALSDEELIAAYSAKSGESEPPESSPLAGMSDEELTLIHSMISEPEKPKPKPQPKPAEVIDTHSSGLTQVPPAVEAAQNFYADQTNFNAMPAQRQGALWQALPTNKAVGGVVQNIADALAPVTGAITQQFPQIRKARDEAAGMNPEQRAVTKLNAEAKGVADTFDAIMNLAPQGMRGVLGNMLPTNANGATDTAAAIQSATGGNQLENAAPDLYQVQQGIGSLVAPLPGMGNTAKAASEAASVLKAQGAAEMLAKLARGVDAGKAIPTMLNMGTEGAVINSLLAQGAARKEGKNASPQDLAAAAGFGALGGAGLGGLAKGAEAAVRGVGRIPEHIRAAQVKASTPTAKDADAIAQVNAKRQAAIDELIKSLPEDSEERQALEAARAAMPAQAQAQTSVQGQVINPPQKQPEYINADVRAREKMLDKLPPDSAAVEAMKLGPNAPESVMSARRAQENIDWTLPEERTPQPSEALVAPEPTDKWTAALDRIKNSTNEAERMTALRDAEAIRRDQLKGLPKTDTKRQLAKKLQAELSDADVRSRARKAPSQPVPVQTVKPEPIRPAEPLPERPPEPVKAPEPPKEEYVPTDKERQYFDEKEKFPQAFQPIGEEGSRLRGYRATFANELTPSQLDKLHDWMATELERPSNKTKSGELRKSAEVKELQKDLQTVIQEKMRRDYRKNRGLEPDHPMDAEPEPMAAGEPAPPEPAPREPQPREPGVADYLSEHDHQKLQMREQGQPVAQGDVRYTPNKLGRERINNGDEIHVDSIEDHSHLAPMADELRARTQGVVEAKAEYDRLKATEDAYFNQILDHFGAEEVSAHGVKLQRNELTPQPNREMEGIFDAERQRLASGVEKDAIPETAAVTLAQELGPQTEKLPKPMGADPNAPENAKVFQAAKNLRAARLEAEKALDANRKLIKEPIKSAQSAHESTQSRKLLLQADSYNPTIKYNDDGTIGIDIGEGTVRGGVEHVNAKDRLKLSDEAKQSFENFKAAQLASFPEKFKKVQSVILKALSTKKGKSALGIGGLISSLVQGSEAHAAETAQAVAQHSNLMWDVMQHAGPEATALMAALKMGPGIAKKLLDDTSPVGMLGQVLWNDTVDKLGQLDKFMGTTLAKDIWTKYYGRVYEASFGVHFKGNERQEGLAALREGLAPADALSGKAGTPFETMTPEQREAVVVYSAMQKEIGKAVRAQKKAFEEKLAANPNHGLSETTQIAFWRDALNHIEDSINPKARNFVEKGASYVIGNFSDYHFFWNPKFHATNLMDQWITGGLRVGLRNIAEANRVLMPGIGDKDLASAFKVSNFTGGLTEERVAQGVAGKTKTNVNDIPSDKINADRVMLGAVFQKFHELPDITKTQLKSNGINNHVDFAKALFLGNTNKIDPTLAMETFGHMADVGSRTLGVDPYRLNIDTLSMKGAKAFTGIFLRQPARMARLAMNEIANGKFGNLALVMAGMVTVAGSAALPAEVRYLWDQFDKDDWRKVRDFLDNLAPIKNNAKHEWSLLMYPLMAANTNILDEGRDAYKAGKDAYSHLLSSTADAIDGTLDMKKFAVDSAKVVSRLTGAIGAAFMPRIGGVFPTRAIAQAGKAAERLTNDEIRVYPDNNVLDNKSAIPRGKTFKPGDLGMSPLDILLDPIAMGEHAGVARARTRLADENRDKASSADDQNWDRITSKLSSGDLFRQLSPSQNR